MLEDKLPEVIRLTYNLKVIVAASYKAKESLAAKGISPAIFMDRFYKEKSQGPHEISYNFNKEKQMRPLPEFVTIDIDDYTLIRKEDKDPTEDIDENLLSNKIMESMNQTKLKELREVDKAMLSDRSNIEKFINNQGFHWFENSVKQYNYALSLGQENFKANTSDQPQGICFVIEVEKENKILKPAKEIFEKVKNEIDLLIKNLFKINPESQKHIKTMLLILYNESQECTVQDALEYTKYFKENTNIPGALVFRLGINGEDLNESIEWSRFNRPIFHFNFNLKSSDEIRIIAAENGAKLQEVVSHHKETIRKTIEARLEELTRKYEDANKATKLIASFFKGSSSDGENYNKEELDMRELADKMFILEDYKRAFDIYKSLASKMEKRNSFIENNIAEMIQLCLAMSKFHNIKLKNDPYNEIEKYADRILNFYEIRSKIRLKRYLLFLVYVFHTFRTFDKKFIRHKFYSVLKNTFVGTSSKTNIISILIYEQVTNMNLFYPHIDFRKYCYDLTRVASRFTDLKMHYYALRCFFIVEGLYRETFANIERYGAIQTSHLLLESRNFKESLKYLKSSWVIYATKIENENLEKNEQEIAKQKDNHSKLMKEIERQSPNELLHVSYPNLKIPIIHSLNLQTKDEMLDFDEKSGLKWGDIGEIILESKELMSSGMNQREFRNLFKAFDCGIPEEKYLIYKLNSNIMAEAILKKSSRNTFVGEPIKVTFYMRNPLRCDISITNINLNLKPNSPKVSIEYQKNATEIQPFKSENITFTLTPTEAGYLEFKNIEWIFMSMLTEYHIKEPQEAISEESRNCFLKLNVHPQLGCLESKAHFEDYYYEGEKGKMKILMTNTGVEKITKVYIASGEEEVFGFRLKEIEIDLAPSSNKEFEFEIKIPLVQESTQSGEEKKVAKLLILYKTGDKFRISRTINKFNILRIAKFDNFVCERLSNHLHLLSFSKKKTSNKENVKALEWMVIPGGFEIVKEEAAELVGQTNYFFFIRKGNYPMAKFRFLNSAQDISSYSEEFVYFEDSLFSDKTINVRFLWRKEQKNGFFSKNAIPIVINEHAYLSTVFPVNFKINYNREFTNNFQETPYLEIPIEIKLKNALLDDDLKLIITFNESSNSDATWEGVTEKKLTLPLGKEIKVNIKYIVVRPGIYNLAKEIKYRISGGKSHEEFKITHSEYEQLYLTVKSNQPENNNKFDFEDAFKEFSVGNANTIHSKEKEEMSLI